MFVRWLSAHTPHPSKDPTLKIYPLLSIFLIHQNFYKMEKDKN